MSKEGTIGQTSRRIGRCRDAARVAIKAFLGIVAFISRLLSRIDVDSILPDDVTEH